MTHRCGVTLFEGTVFGFVFTGGINYILTSTQLFVRGEMEMDFYVEN